MCIILDANMLSRFKKRADEDIKPVWDWVYNRNGKIAYSTTEKFKEEWTRGGGDNVLKELQTIKKLKPVSAQDVQEKQNELEGQIRSNDPHIIALAIVANVRVLVSEDRTLIDDFTNRDLVARGRVYQRAEHAHLLTNARCP